MLDQGVAGLTIGLDPAWIDEGVAPEVASTVHAAARVLQAQGAILCPVALPALPDVVDIWYDICAVQTARVHEESYARHGQAYSAALSAIIRHGQSLPAEALARAQNRRAAYTASLIEALNRVDLVVIPVLPFAPPSLARTRNMDRAVIDALHRFTCLFTLSGAPCITFPGAMSREGAPLAVQLVAPPSAKERLIRAAPAFQTRAGGQDHRPPLG